MIFKEPIRNSVSLPQQCQKTSSQVVDPTIAGTHNIGQLRLELLEAQMKAAESGRTANLCEKKLKA